MHYEASSSSYSQNWISITCLNARFRISIVRYTILRSNSFLPGSRNISKKKCCSNLNEICCFKDWNFTYTYTRIQMKSESFLNQFVDMCCVLRTVKKSSSGSDWKWRITKLLEKNDLPLFQYFFIVGVTFLVLYKHLPIVHYLKKQ